MTRRDRRDDTGHPLFWLFLGFLSGVIGTLGALLILGEDSAREGRAVSSEVVTIPLPVQAAPPVVLIPPPHIEPKPQVEVQATRPTTPPVVEETRPETTPPPPRRGGREDQIAEDAAASGMTSRTR